MAGPADRNLLFGILALQMDFVTRDHLVAAMNAWVLAKDRPLADMLGEQGALKLDHRTLLEALVQAHLAQHGNDGEKSLAALSSLGSAQKELQLIADADLQASLDVVASARADDDPYATRATVGEPTSAGLRFRILRPHAEGGLGKVYVADDGELHREVALKEIKDKFADHPESRARFVVEAEITGGLEHPGIVPVYGLGTYADGRPFYAMRFIRGDSLKEAIKRFHGGASGGREPPGSSEVDQGAHAPRSAGFDSLEFRRLLGRFVDVCNAIAYAHSRKVLHRDLKPGNIMLGKYGETLVVDWGLAKAIGRAESVGDRSDEPSLRPASASGTAETLAGEAIGTPEFMSPEQAGGRIDLMGPPTDIYSLGATLYAILTGRPPVSGANVPEVLREVERGEIPPPRSLVPAAPAALAAACLKAMALKPADRYASALDLAADVEHWLADEPVTAWREPASVQVWRWVRKHTRLVASVGAALTVGAVALAVGLAAVDHQRRLTAAQERETAKALKLADRRFDMALAAYDEMVFGMQDLMERRSSPVEARRELLAKARPGLEKLLAEAESARGADHTLVAAFFRLGRAALLIGDAGAARTEYEKGRELAQRLAAANPKNAQAERDLSASFENLGDVSLQLGDAAAARDFYTKGLELTQQLADTDPTNAAARRDLSLSCEKLGDVSMRLGDSVAARDFYRKRLELAERLAAADPKNAAAQRDLAISFGKLGNISVQLGEAAAARDFYRQSLELAERLAAADPKNAAAQRDLSISLEKLGNISAHMGAAGAARDFYRRGFVITQRLADADAKNVQGQRDLSFSLLNLGNVSVQLGEAAAARDFYRQGLDIRQRLAAADPKNAEAQRDLSFCFDYLGEVSVQLGDTAAARDFYRQSLDIDLRLAAADPKNAQAQQDLFFSFLKMGEANQSLLEFVEAKAWYGRAKTSLARFKAEGWVKTDTEMVGGSSFGQCNSELDKNLAACANADRAAADLNFALHQPVADVPGLLDIRLRVLAKKRDAAGCVATAEALEKLGKTDPGGLYDSARL